MYPTLIFRCIVKVLKMIWHLRLRRGFPKVAIEKVIDFTLTNARTEFVPAVVLVETVLN